MLNIFVAIFLSLFAANSYANDYEIADKAWAPGKPWPTHWGLIKYPYAENWNVVLMAYVNKIYRKDEVADTWLKDIPYAQQEDASVEVCMGKRGMLELATLCQPGIVDPTIRGSLKEGDIVGFFYPNHGTKRFSKGPGSDARTTIRVFQRIASANDNNCWVRMMLVFKTVIADECFAKIDRSLVDTILTRDFGPREGSQNSTPNIVTTSAYVADGPVKREPPLVQSPVADDAIKTQEKEGS